MTPYYQDDLVTIYHGDMRDVLPTLRATTVDAVVTDPPFFMPAVHFQSRIEWQRTWGDTSILAAFWRATLDETIRLLKPSGHFLAFCNGDSYPVFYPEMYRRFDYLKALVWDKGHVGLGRVWRGQHELIIAARWSEVVFNEDGRLRADVLRAAATPSSERDHPVEKPVSLLGQLIEPTTLAGGVVLDPFMGSGTTLEAAKSLGRRAIGVDTEERYCEVAALRCSQEVLSLSEPIVATMVAQTLRMELG